MKMHTMAAFVAATVLSTAGVAHAAVTLDYSPSGNLTFKLHNTKDDTATTVTTDVPGESFLVDLTGDSALNQAGNGSGFAQVEGTPVFNSVLIDPTNFDGFQAFQFNIDPQKKVTVDDKDQNVVEHMGTFRIDYTFVGGGSGFLIADLALSPNTKFRLTSDGAALSTITLSDLNGFYKNKGSDIPIALGFDNIRQMSFDAPGTTTVPEPATWAMMILGFGAAGAMMRRRRALMA